MEVLSAIVDAADLGRSKLVARYDEVHQVSAVKSLKGRNAGGVYFDGTLNLVEVVTEGGEPFDFHMWVRSGNIRKERNAGADGILGPCDSDT